MTAVGMVTLSAQTASHTTEEKNEGERAGERKGERWGGVEGGGEREERGGRVEEGELKTNSPNFKAQR